MGSNAEIFARHLRLVKKDNEEPLFPRTQYAIRNVNGLWFGENYRWVEHSKDALKFDFMTFAMTHATMEMGFTLDMFTVEAV